MTTLTLESAAAWALRSAFSNAGQRCASASRIIVFDRVYNQFRDLLVSRAERLRVGPGDDDDFGPVINYAQLQAMVTAVERVRHTGAVVLTGGHRLTDDAHRDGFYMAPTLIGQVDPGAEISVTELFGPIACLYRARDFGDAVALATTPGTA